MPGTQQEFRDGARIPVTIVINHRDAIQMLILVSDTLRHTDVAAKGCPTTADMKMDNGLL